MHPPEVERRIMEFRSANGSVGFGGWLVAADDTPALPDNLGLMLPEVAPPGVQPLHT